MISPPRHLLPKKNRPTIGRPSTPPTAVGDLLADVEQAFQPACRHSSRHLVIGTVRMPTIQRTRGAVRVMNNSFSALGGEEIFHFATSTVLNRAFLLLAGVSGSYAAQVTFTDTAFDLANYSAPV